MKKIRNKSTLFMRVFVIALLAFLILACDVGIETQHSVKPKDYAVASAHTFATQAGIEILKNGGNAFDAAIAITASLAVVEPYSSGIGGGGFYLLHLAEENKDIFLDAREVAPMASSADMYLDANGEPTNKSTIGAAAAGIPGIPAAIVHLAEQYGQFPLEKSLGPAIRMAKQGFEISEYYQKRAELALEKLLMFSDSANVFLHNGVVPPKGFVLKQPDLALVLERIGKEGMDGFYRGETAMQLVSSVQKHGGIWTLKDLQLYQVRERKPITGKYKNIRITSAPPPSSGGIVILQSLNMLSDIELNDVNETQRIHYVVEAMRRAYRDRAELLGDSDFVQIPIEKLLSMEYAKQQYANFNYEYASVSKELLSTNDVIRQQGDDTTHFSVIDQYGNKVAATLSVNYNFGSGFVAEGTGVLLNNEMDDFSIKPGHPNLWGLVGSHANAIEPGKRMLSSMSPTFLDDGERVAIIGTPGGSRIISMVLLATMAFADGADANTMVSLPRYHHQFLPDQIQFEKEAFDSSLIATLNNKGHEVIELGRKYGNMHIVIWDKKNNSLDVASDPRAIGTAMVGN